MEGNFNVIYLMGSSKVGKDGKNYYSATVMSGDTVMKLGCEEHVLDALKDKQMKPVTVIIKLTEYNNTKSAKIVGVA